MNETSQGQTSIFLRIPIQWIIFIIQGIFLLFFNLIIVGSIAKYVPLRTKKEYVLFGALALSDALSGFGYFLLGIHNIWVVNTDQVGVKMSSWSCMKRPHNWFLGFGGPLSGLMLACVSLDRLFCVANPLKYNKLKSDHAWKMVRICYSVGIASFAFLIATSYLEPDVPRYSKFCQTTKAIGHPLVKQYFLMSRAIGGMASVVIYLMMLPLNKRATRILYADKVRRKDQIERDLKRQKRLSNTVGICVFFTFMLFVLPNMAKSYFNLMVLKNQPTAIVVLTGYASCIQNMNPVLNIFLYALKLKDMRKGMTAFIFCKSINQVHITTTTTFKRKSLSTRHATANKPRL